MKNGFNMALNEDPHGRRFIQVSILFFVGSLNNSSFPAPRCQTFHSTSLTDNYAPALIATMYNRRVNSISDVLDHICYDIVASAADGTTPLFLELFKRRLKRYMEGTGHPPHPFIHSSGLANEYEIDRDQSSSVLRAQHFLLACTESDLLPADDHFKIKVSSSSLVLISDTIKFNHLLSVCYPWT